MLAAFPILYRLSPATKRDWLNRCREYTTDQRTIERHERELKRTIGAESRIFAQIIKSTLDHAGLYHRAKHEFDGPEDRPRKHKKLSIQFDYIGYSEDVIYLRVMTRKRGLFNKYYSALPLGVSIEDICNDIMRENLSHACKRAVMFKRDEYNKGLWIKVYRLETIDDLPQMVPYNAVMRWYPATPDELPKLPLLLGVGEHRYIHRVNLADFPHVLVAGGTGGGKSNIVNLIIATLMRYQSPADLKFVLIDPKRLEFAFYEDSPHLLKPVINSIEDAVKELSWIGGEIERRTKLLQGSVKKLSDWNITHPRQREPNIILVIDEYAVLRLLPNKKIADRVEALLTDIGNRGRAVGIRMILCTQRPAATVISNAIKINCQLVLAVRTRNTDQSRVILDDGAAAELPLVNGRMIYDTGNERHIIQSVFISDSDVGECIAIARGKHEGMIELIGDKPAIIRDGFIRWIRRNRGGKLSGLSRLNQYGITQSMLTNFKDILRGEGLTERVGNAEYIRVDPAAIRSHLPALPAPSMLLLGDGLQVHQPRKKRIEPANDLPGGSGENVIHLANDSGKTANELPIELPAATPPRPPKRVYAPLDWLARFVAAEIEIGGESYMVSAGGLYSAYVQYCQRNQTEPLSNVRFAESIKELTGAIPVMSRRLGGSGRGYRFIRLVDSGVSNNDNDSDDSISIQTNSTGVST